MKIVSLQAENLKRIRAVEITPDPAGNLVVIAGRNGQGKTSVLDSIWFALGGGPATKDTTRPIRDGEAHAEVRLDLGDLIVTRTWNGDKTALKVESPDGAAYKTPQSMLDGLVGRLSFDPLAFAQQPERTQLASLLELVDLPIDVDDLDRRRAGLYEKRTDVGRTVKQLHGQLAGIPRPDPRTPTTEVSVSALLQEHRDAQSVVSAYDEWVREEAGIAASVERATERVASLEAQLVGARASLSEHKLDLAGAREQIERRVHELPDIAAIGERLATAEDTNAAVRLAAKHAELVAEHASTVTEYERLSSAIKALDQEKADAIAAANMPIDGLAFDEDGVTYRGVPFKQCSAAEQLRVSLAMSMAMNPRIRVIRITDGSLLDSANMRLIEEMAAQNDFQVWIERVDESGQVGVVIEDGLVA